MHSWRLTFTSRCQRVRKHIFSHGAHRPLSVDSVNGQVPHVHDAQAARLLVKLRALECQRRSNALLGCCLRLSARLGARFVHLGRNARSARRGTLWGTLAVSAKLTMTCPMLHICVASKQ